MEDRHDRHCRKSTQRQNREVERYLRELQCFREENPAESFPDISEFGTADQLRLARNELAALRKQRIRLLHDLKVTRQAHRISEERRFAATAEVEAERRKTLESIEALNFECVFCLSTVNDPVESPCCGALGCAKCFDRHNACPYCRSPLTTVVPLRSLRRIVWRLPTECPNIGCSVVVERSALEDHLKNCDYNKVNCRYHCGMRLTHSSQSKAKHEVHCPLRPTVCHACGASSLIAAELDSHIKEKCLMALCTCPECKQLVLRKDVPAHRRGHKRRHLLMRVGLWITLIVSFICLVWATATICKAFLEGSGHATGRHSDKLPPRLSDVLAPNFPSESLPELSSVAASQHLPTSRIFFPGVSPPTPPPPQSTGLEQNV